MVLAWRSLNLPGAIKTALGISVSCFKDLFISGLGTDNFIDHIIRKNKWYRAKFRLNFYRFEQKMYLI